MAELRNCIMRELFGRELEEILLKIFLELDPTRWEGNTEDGEIFTLF